MSRVLVIVDVQKEFDDFIQRDLVDELYDYAEKFEKVYQIWDSNKNQIKPTYEFPNQVKSVKKKFGRNHFNNKVQKFTQDIEDVSKEGTTFKLTKGNGYIIRVDNNHQWFYVNPEITDLIEELKDDEVVLVGGADGECLEDVKVAFEAFGLNYRINKKYVYSAKTDKNDTIKDNISEAKKQKFEYDEICYKVQDQEDEDFIKSYLTTQGYDYTGLNSIHTKPYYLFVDIKKGNLTHDTIHSLDRLGGLINYTKEYEYSIYPVVFDRSSFSTFRGIIEYGEIIPDYRPRRKLNESIKDILKGKSKEDIENAMEDLLTKITDEAIELFPKKFTEWTDTYKYFEKYRDIIKKYILQSYTISNVIYYIVNGYAEKK